MLNESFYRYLELSSNQKKKKSLAERQRLRTIEPVIICCGHAPASSLPNQRDPEWLKGGLAGMHSGCPLQPEKQFRGSASPSRWECELPKP